MLAAPGTLHATSMVDVEITLLASARPLEDGARVRVHLASAEALARLIARTLEARLDKDYTARALARIKSELSASEIRRLSRRRHIVVATEASQNPHSLKARLAFDRSG